VRLPNPENAVVDVRKLRDYCLSPEHPRGKHKAQVFSVALGLGTDDAEELREAVAGEEDEYGKRYVLDLEMRTAVGTATVRCGWIVRHGEDFPRLTSRFAV
jgi:hypothetical protein